MFHLDADAVHKALPWREAVNSLRYAHATREKPFESVSVFDAPDASQGQFVNLTVWSAARTIAVKMVGVFSNNSEPHPPQPNIQGLAAVFEGQTGRAIMTCDGAALTYRKMAAVSALGTDLLARSDAEVLAIAGAGRLAPYVVEAHCAVRPIWKVIIWNRSRPKAELMADKLLQSGLEVVVEDFVTALPEADIVSAVTMAHKPVITGAALKPGAHVDLVGAYLPHMREADAQTIRRAGRMFADNSAAFAEPGDGADPVAEGLIPGVEADFFDLCQDLHFGRRSATEITVCKNGGGGHLDLFLAEHLFRWSGKEAR